MEPAGGLGRHRIWRSIPLQPPTGFATRDVSAPNRIAVPRQVHPGLTRPVHEKVLGDAVPDGECGVAVRAEVQWFAGRPAEDVPLVRRRIREFDVDAAE